MIIKIIEPIGQSEDAIRARIGDLLEEGGHSLVVCDSRGMADTDLIKVTKDADVLLLSNRPLSGNVIKACPKLKLICVAFTGIDHVDQETCKNRGIVIHNAAGFHRYICVSYDTEVRTRGAHSDDAAVRYP